MPKEYKTFNEVDDALWRHEDPYYAACAGRQCFEVTKEWEEERERLIELRYKLCPYNKKENLEMETKQGFWSRFWGFFKWNPEHEQEHEQEYDWFREYGKMINKTEWNSDDTEDLWESSRDNPNRCP